ncbi:hypothetical protein Y592_03855 [Thermosipho sp. 1070]|nr:hypothetical protein Y592_03855 [Thermosipho sp. 1070]
MGLYFFVFYQKIKYLLFFCIKRKTPLYWFYFANSGVFFYV